MAFWQLVKLKRLPLAIKAIQDYWQKRKKKVTDENEGEMPDRSTITREELREYNESYKQHQEKERHFRERMQKSS